VVGGMFLSDAMNYYNENDPFAVKWLKGLIECGLIPKGDVDDRSIIEVEPSDLKGYTQCHFFAGIGGWSYALQLSRWDADRPVWTGSCPCQSLSCAGKGLGEKDERHLWPVFFNLIAELRPPEIFGEQVASKDGREWLSGVRNDLEAVGYAVGAADLPACGVGAPHRRNRLFWVADANGQRQQGEQVRLCGQSGNGETRQEVFEVAGGSGTNFWSNSIFIPCADGKLRRVPGRLAESESVRLQESGYGLEIKSSFLLLSDGFWYRMASVYSELITQAIREIENYAKETGLNPNEVVQMVQKSYGEKEIQSKEKQEPENRETGRQSGISEKEMLFTFMCDISSALNRSSDDSGGEKEGAEDNERVLRDLREHIENKCASYRRQSEKQQSEKPSASLLALSQFLAQCSETCRYYNSRADAVTFPLAGNVTGRVGVLRGAGNAIVPQVAAEFIKAYCEI